ncbi:MAG TPA: hypothetical protein DCL38_05365 [Lachnospiraceae bacterium]|nr:hypothetical protein [Lachnospiraceae bacterium]
MRLKDHAKAAAVLRYALLLVVAALFLLIFSLWTSPFYKHWYGCDASFFSMVGRGITEGMVPYRDFFDLKGPWFFLIEALGQLIHRDRLGVYLLQIPFLWASLILIVKLSRLYLSRGKTAAVLLIFLFGHISILWGGNTLEEFMLPLNLLTVYLTVRFLKTASIRTDGIPFYIPLVNGICFGIMLFAKITVAAPVMGVCAGTGIALLALRRYRELLLYILYFVLGVLIADIPVLLYFYLNDSLSTMLYCVFEFAFKRSIDFSDPFSAKWELKLTACYLGFFTAVFHIPVKEVKASPCTETAESIKAAPEYSVKYALRRLGRFIRRKYTGNNVPTIRTELCLILIFMSLFTYILLHLGNPWIYYFMTAEPILVLSTVLLLGMYDPLVLFSSVRQAVCLITLGIYIFYFGGHTMETVQTFLYERGNQYYEEYYQNAQNIALLIPESERDSVFSFDIDMTFFEATQIMPCYKYQINLQFFIALNPAIQDEIMEYFDKTPPKWLIVSETLNDYLPDICEMMIKKYHCLYFNSAGCLYVLNDH